MKLFGRDPNEGPPLIVAEIGANHLGYLHYAKELIELAKVAGADAVKVQCYDADSLTLDVARGDFLLREGPWAGRLLHSLYREAQTPIEWMPDLFSHAAVLGIPIFSSVFCERGLAMLQSVNCPAYKIASMEITDIPLIEKVAATGKPVIISTGMATDNEIVRAVNAIDLDHKGTAAVLHCVSGYPTPSAEANLRRLESLKSFLFGRPVGISDHTLGIAIPVAATALGARIIEKHFTDSRDAGGPDAAFSLNPSEFKQMVVAVKQAWEACQPSSPRSEESSRQLRRSLYAVQGIAKGEQFTKDNVRSIRPSYGLPPVMLPQILGKTATQNIDQGTALKKEMIK